jgi:hypothetical protein
MMLFTVAAPGDPARAALDSVRQKIAELRAEMERVKDAVLPLADAVERALSEVRRRADLYENRLTGFACAGFSMPPSASPLGVLDVWAILYNASPDLAEKGLSAHLKQACAGGVALAARSKRIAELRTKLTPLLDQEESAFVDLLARDIVVERDVPETAEDIQRLLTALDRDAA